ncbi:aspartate 1-decarboxylase [archaeon]|jgi:aspartate 1-decarboxylase|nr:aspartate 1-decarboxylase [archaeon]
MKWFLSSKIHKAIVTEANLDYTGSITIDRKLMKFVGLEVGEKVLVSDITNGARLETYVISGKKGEICMNGAAAHLIKKGDQIIIMGFKLSRKPVKSKIILVNDDNELVRSL